jgi:hypothetical protein
MRALVCLGASILASCGFPYDGSDLHGRRSTNGAVAECSGIHPHVLSFRPAADVVVANGNGALAAADFNRDNRLDLAIASQDDNQLYVLLGNGDGSFAAPAGYATQAAPRSLTVGDFDGDGHLDVAVANRDSNSFSLFYNQGDGTFATRMDYQSGGAPAKIIAGDVNLDGKPDLVLASSADNHLSVFLNLDHQRNPFTAALTTLTFANQFPVGMALSDVNTDGMPDLVACSALGGGFSLFVNDNGTFATAIQVPDRAADPGCNALDAGDLNGDGVPDVMVEYLQGMSMSLFLNGGNGSFASAPVSYDAGHRPADLTICDFNGDGRQDVATLNADDSNLGILLGNAHGTLDSPLDTALPQRNAAASHLLPGDFNGDGLPDIAVWNSDGRIQVLLNQH